MNIIHKCCDPELSKDKQLPVNSYLISYIDSDELKHDIVQANSQVDVFNYYYDEYKNIKSIDWTNGGINPKTYGYIPKELYKKRK